LHSPEQNGGHEQTDLFYRVLADHYDEMTRFQDRLEREHEVLSEWVEKYGIESAVDVGCGTGLHSILLARMGVSTIGTDLSLEMLKKAGQNAVREEVEVEWMLTPMENLGQDLDGQWDAVFCLGNSLPHLLSDSALRRTLKGFKEHLKPDGVCIIQLLNYKKILAQKKRIVGIHRVGEIEFVRFYDFLDETIRFNILTIDWSDGGNQHSLASTELYPYDNSYLTGVMRELGFGKLSLFGDMKFRPFNEEESPNLVVAAIASWT
jgi:2-polyprenyl-3-methyl-5-hydroxy-6-metoxy-1,4-benzoquinol methylase